MIEATETAAGPDSGTPSGQDRFPVETEAYTGTLEELLRLSQRGEFDLSTLQVSEITAAFRQRVEATVRAGEAPDLREISEFLGLASRLAAQKAKVALPEESTDETEIIEPDPETEAGRRLAEYRLFRAAADALLSGAAEEGARNFLGLVVPEVVPVERLRIQPEKLAAAFRAVLQRFPDAEPLQVGVMTFSVAEMATKLRVQLTGAGELDFDAIFEQASSRLEAVAIFLALLELLRNGEAEVAQKNSLGPITVSAA